MSQIEFLTNLTPQEAADKVRGEIRAECVHDERHVLPENKHLTILVFEKYYMRNSSRAALTLICEDFEGETRVRAIATGSSQSMIFKFDWGASQAFAEAPRQILQRHIIG